MEFLLIWVLFGIVTAVVASNKGRSGGGWFLLGVLLGPFALILALVVSKHTAVVEAEAVRSGSMKKCPFCAELIKAEAIKCRFCGSEIPLKVELEKTEKEIKQILLKEPNAKFKLTEGKLIDFIHHHYAKQDFKRCKIYLEKLLNDYPKGDYAAFARERLSEVNQKLGLQ